MGGEFGAGRGEDFIDTDLDDSGKGIYIPIWMPGHELSLNDNIYPDAVAIMILKSRMREWPNKPITIIERN